MKNKILAGLTIASILLVALVGFNLSTENAFALVSVDINPSVDLKVNEDQEVIEIIAMNDDALEVTHDGMIGQPLLDVIDEIIMLSQEKEFLNDDNNTILISSASLEKEDTKDLNKLIDKYVEGYEDTALEVTFVESDKETAEASLEAGISLGKLEISKTEASSEMEALDVEAIEEEDNLYADTLEFLSKVNMLVINEYDNYQTLVQPLVDLGVDFSDTEFFGLTEDNENLLAIKKLAQEIWHPLQKEFQKEWAFTNGDTEEVDQELYDSTMEFLSKLAMVDRTVGEDAVHDEDYLNRLETFLSTYGLDLTIEGYQLEATNPKMLLIKHEAQELWKEVMHDYQKQWAALNGDDQDLDEADVFSEADLKDLQEWAQKLNFVKEDIGDGEDEYKDALIAFLSHFDADYNIIGDIDLFDLKDQGKALFFHFKDEYKKLWNAEEDDMDLDADDHDDDKDKDLHEEDGDDDNHDGDLDEDENKGKAKGKNK